MTEFEAQTWRSLKQVLKGVCAMYSLQGILQINPLWGIACAMEATIRQIVRLPSQLGAIVQSERLRRGMTQSELASLTGTQQKTISAIENGSAGTKLDTLLSVIASLGLDMQIAPRERDGKSIEDVF